MLVTETTGQVIEPYEEAQWVLEQVNKYGRDKKKAQDAWKGKLAGHWRRDNLGFEGCLRLWLPAKEYEDKATSKFAKGASKESSKLKKTPNATELDAFRSHATEADLDHSHEFFRGGAQPRGLTDDIEVEVAPGVPEADAAEVSAGAGQAPKTSSLKRKGISMCLDASEDEDEADNKSKKSSSGSKKRKSVNLASQRTSLFESLSRTLTQKSLSMRAKIQEAKSAQDKEKNAPAPPTATDVITRRLYNEALVKCLLLAKAWDNQDDVKTELDIFNKGCADGGKPDQVIKVDGEETKQQMHPILAWALDQAGHAANIERKLCLRTRMFMTSFVNDLSSKDQAEITEDDLDSTRLLWKRMLTAATQLEASLKKCTVDVTKHVAGLAAAAERNEKKRRDREAKEAESRHLEQTKAKLKKAVADGADLPAVFKLGQEATKAMMVVEGNAISNDRDLSEPFVLKKSSHIHSWAGNAIVLQTMTNFGARHKKAPDFESTGKLSQPFVTKAGREVSEKCFTDIVSPVKAKIVDLEKVAPGWSTTSWMFALAPKRSFITFSPNSAAFLRVLMYGDVEVYTLSVQSFMEGLQTASVAEPKTTSELEEAS